MSEKEQVAKEDLNSRNTDQAKLEISSYLFEETEVDSIHLRAPPFFKTTRRRSKTYSGESLSSHLEKIEKFDPKSQEDLNDLPDIISNNKKKDNSSHHFLYNRRFLQFKYIKNIKKII